MRSPTLLLALAVGCLGLTGCGGWLTREAVPTTTPPMITVQDIRPTGAPLVTIQTTPVGWHITARQPIERTEVEERAVTERVQRTLFFPPALLTGLIQCPIGSLTWMLSLGTYGRDLATHGCWRLLMIETLPGDATMTSQVTNTTRTVTDSEFLRGAIVQLEHTPHLTNWTGILAPDGTLLIPYRAVSEHHTDRPSAHLSIQRQHDTIWRGPLPEIPKAVQIHPSPRAWPTPLVFQIEESTVGDPTVLHPLRQLLQHELLRHGHCVVVGESTRAQLRNEVGIQQAGLITDTRSTPSLNWIPATVLIRTAQDSPGKSDDVQISWIDVERGQIIDEEKLYTSVNKGHLSTQIRMMMQEKLPQTGKCRT